MGLVTLPIFIVVVDHIFLFKKKDDLSSNSSR